jgi:hypothetical protein
LPHELLRPTETGRLFERLAAPAGLDFAAVEAFVLAQRGHVAARPVRDGGAIVELFLPVVNARS